MKNKYKDSMDKIIVDEEMKKRIISNLNKIEKPKQKNKIRFIRRVGMYAACLAIVLGGVTIKSFLSKTDLNEDKYVVVEDETMGIQNENNGDNQYIREVPEEKAEDNTENFKSNTNSTDSKQKETPKKEQKIIAYNDNKDNLIQNRNEEKKITNQESNSNTEEIDLNIEEMPHTSLNENTIINEETAIDKSDIVIEDIPKQRSMKLDLNNAQFKFKVPKVLEENYEKNINFINDNIIDISYKKDDNAIEYKIQKGSIELNYMDNYKDIKINNIDFKFNMNKEDSVTSVRWNDNNVSYNMEAYKEISEEEAVNIVKSLYTFN